MTTARPQDYKFPETIEEHAAVCEVAEELRQRGNAHYKKGEIVDAAKLYEQVDCLQTHAYAEADASFHPMQAVLKFADWYAECFATEEERKLVRPYPEYPTPQPSPRSCEAAVTLGARS